MSRTMAVFFRHLGARALAQITTGYGWYSGLLGGLLVVFLMRYELAAEDRGFSLKISALASFFGIEMMLRSAQGVSRPHHGVVRTVERPLPALPMSRRVRALAEALAAMVWPVIVAATLAVCFGAVGLDVAGRPAETALFSVALLGTMWGSGFMPRRNTAEAWVAIALPYAAFVTVIDAAIDGAMLRGWLTAVLPFLLLLPSWSRPVAWRARGSHHVGPLDRPPLTPRRALVRDVWTGLLRLPREPAIVLNLVTTGLFFGYMTVGEFWRADIASSYLALIVTATGVAGALAVPATAAGASGPMAGAFAHCAATWPVARHVLARFVLAHAVLWTGAIAWILMVAAVSAEAMGASSLAAILTRSLIGVVAVAPAVWTFALELRFGTTWWFVAQVALLGGAASTLGAMAARWLERGEPSWLALSVMGIVAVMLAIASRHLLPPRVRRA